MYITEINKEIPLAIYWDDLSLNERKIIEYANEYLNPEPPKNIEPHNSFSESTSEFMLAHSGANIYSHMRDLKIFTDSTRKYANDLKKYKTKKDLVVYRGIHDFVFDIMNSSSQPNFLYDFSFLSCSLLKPHIERRNNLLRIYVPKGSNMVYMGNINNEENRYYEVVIQCNATLKIINPQFDEYINCVLISTF